MKLPWFGWVALFFACAVVDGCVGAVANELLVPRLCAFRDGDLERDVNGRLVCLPAAGSR